jgi:hypothetical protein
MRVIVAGVLIFPSAALISQSKDKPTESKHRPGPNGLEGWTLNYTVPDHGDERYPTTLVIARNNRILSRIDGEPFVWKWIFWANGKQVAYEAAPFHFSLDCVLADSKTGRRLASFDCFHGIPENAPEWLKALETAKEDEW